MRLSALSCVAAISPISSRNSARMPLNSPKNSGWIVDGAIRPADPADGETTQQQHDAAAEQQFAQQRLPGDVAAEAARQQDARENRRHLEHYHPDRGTRFVRNALRGQVTYRAPQTCPRSPSHNAR